MFGPHSTFGQHYTGPVANSWRDLDRYTGDRGVEAVVGPDRQEACRVNCEQIQANYNGGIEFQLRRKAAILCPQTVEFLYTRFTPTTMNYERGSRPRLEAAVETAVGTNAGERDRALALMRFCRDLYKMGGQQDIRAPDYVFGGTEEALIDKHENLCECLARLFVALCEVAGMPGRIVAHVIGGHFAAEVLVDGHWGYIDPRAGVHFVKPDGTIASLWELWHNPVLWHSQPASVRAEVSGQWTWAQRLWACERKFFHPLEVNAFENYRLCDTDQYDYCQVTQEQATARGLWKINDRYASLIDRVFGLAQGGKTDSAEGDRIALTYRNDGFSQYYYHEPPMTREVLERQFIDMLEGGNVDVLEWGLGPGSVLCYDTKVGTLLGQGLSEAQWQTMRHGDRRVHENVMTLIRAGADPLKVAIDRGHALGLKVHGGLRMNHIQWYGPEDSNLWNVLVGAFDRRPEYRIPDRFNHDYRHPEVRERKLAILREATEAGCDGISVCFCSWPPYFEDPSAGKAMMTAFLRDVRDMLDDVGHQQERRIDLVVRIPYGGAVEMGLDWRTWMRERLIDVLVCTPAGSSQFFDVNLDEFIAEGRRRRVKVYGSIFQSLGFAETDETVEDENLGKRHDKPKTREMDCAQALLFHRGGVDGIELAMASDEWRERPWLNSLADLSYLEFADKQYMVDPHPHLPIKFNTSESGGALNSEHTVTLRIADNLPFAVEQGFSPEVAILLYCRSLDPGERLQLFVNNRGPVNVPAVSDGRAPANLNQSVTGTMHDSSTVITRDPTWWARGQRRVPIPSQWLRMGHNTIQFVYGAGSGTQREPLTTPWVEVSITYGSRPPVVKRDSFSPDE